VSRPRHGILLILCSLALAITACSGLPQQNIQPESIFPSPVAFVTAAPLPVATQTPTPVPTVEPTAAPPTAVPKRVPIDSTAAIGIWSDHITSAQTFTGVVDVVLGPAGFDLAKTNLALVTLTARPVHYGYADVLTDVLANHADWLLYDKNKKVALALNRAPLLNIRNDEVKAQLADDVAKLVAESGYDGVVLDGLGQDLIRKNTPPVYTGTKAFTEGQRRDAAEGLLRAIRAKLPDKLLVVGGYAWTDGAAYNASTSDAQDLGTLSDGVHIGEFLHSPLSKTVEFKPESGWKRDVDYLATVSQDNTVVLVSTRIDTSGVPSSTVRQWLGYGVASYLLGKNGAHTYFQFDPGGSIDSINDPIMTAPVGAPLEAYAKLDSGIYKRAFSNGIVLVNPTTKEKETDLGAEYRTLSGTPVQKVTMSPNTGLILLKP